MLARLFTMPDLSQRENFGGDRIEIAAPTLGHLRSCCEIILCGALNCLAGHIENAAKTPEFSAPE